MVRILGEGERSWGLFLNFFNLVLKEVLIYRIWFLVGIELEILFFYTLLVKGIYLGIGWWFY